MTVSSSTLGKRLSRGNSRQLRVKFGPGRVFELAAHPRFRAQVIGLFAGVAVVRAAVGIFSV